MRADMTQPTLNFDAHRTNLTRVRNNIGATVRNFLRERLATNPEFTVVELSQYVTDKCGGAPGSPDRVMRDGRQRGDYDYVLVSRKESRYRVVRV